MKDEDYNAIEVVCWSVAGVLAAPFLLAGGLIAAPAIGIGLAVRGAAHNKRAKELKKEYGEKFCEECWALIDPNQWQHEITNYNGKPRSLNRHNNECINLLAHPDYCAECKEIIPPKLNHVHWCPKYDKTKEWHYCKHCDEVVENWDLFEDGTDGHKLNCPIGSDNWCEDCELICADKKDHYLGCVMMENWDDYVR